MSKDKHQPSKDNCENVQQFNRNTSITYLNNLETSVAGFSLTLTNLILLLRLFRTCVLDREHIPDNEINMYRRAIDELGHNVGNVTLELGYAEGIVRSLNAILVREPLTQEQVKDAYDEKDKDSNQNLPFPGNAAKPEDVRRGDDPHERGTGPWGSGA